MDGRIYFLFPVILPILLGICVKHLPLDRKKRGYASVIGLAVCAVMSVCGLFFTEGARLTVWAITDKITIAFALDGISRFYVAFVSGVWVLVGLYATEYVEHDHADARFFRYYLISYGALMGLSMAENLITMYMFYEMMTLVTVPLVAHNMDKQSVAAAIKYLIYSVFGASLALLGIFFVGAYADTFTFTAGGIFTDEMLAGRENMMRVIFFLMIMGFGVKAGMFPMHSWLPTAHPVAPAPASAVLSGVITKMGVLGIVRCIFYVSGVSLLKGTWVQYAFMTLALLTVVMGSTLALKEKVFKKRLAYSTVSQVSYVLFGLSTMNPIGFVGAFLHILFHSLIKNTLFMSAGAVIHKTGLTGVEDLKRMGRRMPVTMALFTVASLGLIGIPPTGGFISKWNLAMGAFNMTEGFAWIGPVALLLSAILTAGYLLSVTIRAFFAGEAQEGDANSEATWRMLVPMGVMAALIVLLGVFSNGFIQYFTDIANMLI